MPSASRAASLRGRAAKHPGTDTDTKLNHLPYCLFLKRSFYSVLPFSDNRPEVSHLPMGGPGIDINGPTTVRLAPGVPENLLRLYLVACGVGDSRELSNTDDDLISSVYFDVAVYWELAA